MAAIGRYEARKDLANSDDLLRLMKEKFVMERGDVLLFQVPCRL